MEFRPARALLLLVGAHALFTLLDATGKHLARDMGVPLIAFIRHGGQVVLMLAVLGPRHGRALLKSHRPRLQLYRGLAISGFTLFFFSALLRLPQAEATSINFIAPFAVMLLAGPLLGERVGRVRWFGAAGGFLGMLAIIRPGSALDPVGIGFVLLTVVCNVAFQILTRKLATIDNSLATIFQSALIATIVSAAMLPALGLWGAWPQHLDRQEILLLLSLGVTGAIGQWLFIRAYFWSSASFIAPLVFLQVLWAVASGWVFFDQFPDPISLSGMLLVLVSGVATLVFETRRAVWR